MPSSLPKTATDQLLLPEETRIYNSKARPIFVIVALLIWLFGGVSLVYNKVYWIGAILIVLVLIGLFITYKVLTDDNVQLIISTAGITTITDGFHPWAQISDEEIVRNNHSRQRSYHLVYRHPAGQAKMDLGWLKIKHDTLQQLLTEYRAKYTALLS